MFAPTVFLFRRFVTKRFFKQNAEKKSECTAECIMNHIVNFRIAEFENILRKFDNKAKCTGNRYNHPPFWIDFFNIQTAEDETERIEKENIEYRFSNHFFHSVSRQIVRVKRNQAVITCRLCIEPWKQSDIKYKNHIQKEKCRNYIIVPLLQHKKPFADT